MRKLCSIIILVLLLSFPLYVFADSATPLDAEGYPVMPIATVSVYQGSISTAALSYFEGVLYNTLFEDYVICRTGQYTYILALGDIVYNNSSFIMSSGKVYTYNANTTVVTVASATNYSITGLNNGIVYSNLGGYAAVDRGGLIHVAASVIICLVPVYLLIRAGFKSVG